MVFYFSNWSSNSVRYFLFTQQMLREEGDILCHLFNFSSPKNRYEGQREPRILLSRVFPLGGLGTKFLPANEDSTKTLGSISINTHLSPCWDTQLFCCSLVSIRQTACEILGTPYFPPPILATGAWRLRTHVTVPRFMWASGIWTQVLRLSLKSFTHGSLSLVLTRWKNFNLLSIAVKLEFIFNSKF